MGTTPVLVLSVVCQAAAALLAIRLIWLTGKRWAWGLMAGAILMMVARRCVPLVRTMVADMPVEADLAAEMVGLAISVLMLAGIAGMFPVFRRMQDSEQSLRQSQRRLEHLNAVLRAIGNISQLIAKEKNLDRLLRGVCASLTESRGYRDAWIATGHGSEHLEAVAEAGLAERFVPLRERMRGAELPSCMRQVLARASVSVLGNEIPLCPDCPICKLHSDGHTMAVRLAMGGQIYGILVASLPAGAEIDEEGRSLFHETAEDIAFALHGLHLEQQRLKAEKSLRLDESRLETLLKLNQMAGASFQELTDFALEEAVRLTESKIGYLAFMHADETELIMHAWSKTAMDQCQIIDKPIVYQVAETGLWGEAVRQRKPVITNDYTAPNPAKKGYPEGHVHIGRHMNVPVFEDGRVVLVAGVGNKEEPYDDADIRQLTLLMQGMWQLIQRHRAADEVRRARDELEVRVKQRTAELASANEDLKHERYLLHTLMDYLPHNIYFKDAESRFLRINKALAKCFGLEDPSQAQGKTDLDYFTLEHAAQAQADEHEIVRTGRPILDKEERETWPDGRVTWASTTKMPLYDGLGKIVGTFGVSRDITQQKRAEEALRTSETKYRTLYDSSRDAIVMVLPDEGFLSGNAAAIALFGCRDEKEFTSLRPADLSPQYQPDRVLSSMKAQQMMAIAMQRGAHFFEWTHQRRDGGEFIASVLLTRMELEGRTVLQGTVRDITEEKQAAEALRAAKEAAEAGSRAKSTFLANMSHEIRTPLNAIIGMTELVLRSQLSAQQREFLTTVRDSGEALLAVINDILDFSKIEAGKLVLCRKIFDLRESLGDTMKSFALRAHQQGLELAFHIHSDVPRMVIGDYSRLRQVVVNLVSNAIKFTERGEVVLEVSRESISDAEVVLHFLASDTGIGIPEEKRATVFEMFEQADSSMTRRHGGTGLGLAIASRLVDLMGGRIWVESEVARGSRFHFTVRLGLAAPEITAVTAPEPARVRGLKVLVVDDNATNRRILEEILRSWQMVPVTARSAGHAMEILRQAQRAGAPCQLVLTDAHMPQVDGFMLAEQVKQDAEIGRTAVVMLTSGDHPEDAIRCEQLGIADYLLKPVKQSELLEAIELALGLAHPERQPPKPAEKPPSTVGKLRILLAEDSLVNQKLAVALLEGEGHVVHVARNGKEAVAAIDAEAFDLVLMDVQMPEMDGLEAVATIRAKERQTGSHIPIVAMTAHALKGDRERCLEIGMDAYIAKPIRANELFDTIASVFAAPGQSATPPATPRPAQETVEWPEAIRATRGDRGLLRTIVEAAAEEIPRLMTAISEAVTQGNAAQLRLAAHTLKGTMRYFATSQAMELTIRLEKMGQSNDLQGAAECLAGLEAEVQQLAPALSKYLQAKSPNEDC